MRKVGEEKGWEYTILGKKKGGNIQLRGGMVRARKVPGLESLALAAYRQLVVDLAGKVEEAVKGKQLGLGLEQEVG